VGPFTALVLLAEIGDISCFGPARAQTGSDEESHKLVPPDPGGQR
jgi:hypothetical protein